MKTRLTVALLLLLGLALGAAVLRIAGTPPPVMLPDFVNSALGRSGVSNPVTAVLLNFRAYDTLLEVAVLVIAGLSALSMGHAAMGAAPERHSADVLLEVLTRWFVPLLLVLAAYLVWAGSHRPGGAFQAGAVVAAAGVLMRLTGRASRFPGAGLVLRAGPAIGLAGFLLVGMLGPATGAAFLTYPPSLAGGLILGVELVLTVSIALVLLGLFESATPPGGVPDSTGHGAER